MMTYSERNWSVIPRNENGKKLTAHNKEVWKTNQEA